MASPSIAVVIPVGPGHDDHALRAVHSVLRQSIPSRYIVIDDTGGRLWPWLPAGNTIFSTHGQRGVGTARLMGTRAAAEQGYDFICYLDADDILMPRAIESMLRALAANPAASYAYGDGYNLKSGAATYYRAAEYDRAIYGKQNIHNVTALMPTAVAMAGEWTNRHWEDYLFYCSLAIKGYCGVRAPYPVIAYDLGAGYRRELAFGEGSGYALGLAAEYRQRFEQEATMTCGSCGGNRAASVTAQAALVEAPGVAQPDGTVRLAYTGNNAGAVAFKTRGRSYRAAQGDIVYADPADVDWLISTGKFYEAPAVPSADEAVAYVAALDSELGLSPLAGAYDAVVKHEAVAAHLSIPALLADAANESADAVRDLAHGMATRRPSDDEYRAAILRDNVRRAEEDALMSRLTTQHADLIARLSDDVDEPADPEPTFRIPDKGTWDVNGIIYKDGQPIDIDEPADPAPEPLPFTPDDERFTINATAQAAEIAQVFVLPADVFDEGKHGSRGVAEAHAAQLFPPRKRGRKPAGRS